MTTRIGKQLFKASAFFDFHSFHTSIDSLLFNSVQVNLTQQGRVRNLDWKSKVVFGLVFPVIKREQRRDQNPKFSSHFNCTVKHKCDENTKYHLMKIVALI